MAPKSSVTLSQLARAAEGAQRRGRKLWTQFCQEEARAWPADVMLETVEDLRVEYLGQARRRRGGPTTYVPEPSR